MARQEITIDRLKELMKARELHENNLSTQTTGAQVEIHHRTRADLFREIHRILSYPDNFNAMMGIYCRESPVSE